MRFESGWIVAASAGAMGILAALSFAGAGGGEESLRQIVRWSTRLGVPLFSAAFAARPLRQMSANRVTKWLLRNRRYLGLSFAVMHFTHLAALGAIALGYPEPFRSGLDPVTVIGGGTVYALLAAMTVTSFDRPAAWLGRRRWRALHLVGSYALWQIMTSNYVVAATADWRQAVPAAFLLGAFAARVWVWITLRGRRLPVAET